VPTWTLTFGTKPQVVSALNSEGIASELLPTPSKSLKHSMQSETNPTFALIGMIGPSNPKYNSIPWTFNIFLQPLTPWSSSASLLFQASTILHSNNGLRPEVDRHDYLASAFCPHLSHAALTLQAASVCWPSLPRFSQSPSRDKLGCE